MAKTSYSRGGPTIPVDDGGTGAEAAGAARTNLGAGDLTQTAHDAQDHSSIPGAGLGRRRELMLPQGFGGGRLFPRTSVSGAAPAPEAVGLQGQGSLADAQSALFGGSFDFLDAAGLGLGNRVAWNSGGGATFAVHSLLNSLSAPLRVVGQLSISGTGSSSTMFFGVTTGGTAPGTTTLVSAPGADTFFGIGLNALFNIEILGDGGLAVDTGVPFSGGAELIVVLTEAVAGTWTVELLDANTLATVYGPTVFAGHAVGKHGLNFYTTGGAWSIGLWGATVSPLL